MYAAFIRNAKGELVPGCPRTYGKPATVKAAMVMIEGGPEWEFEGQTGDVLVYKPSKRGKKHAGSKLYWVNIWGVATSKLSQVLKRVAKK